MWIYTFMCIKFISMQLIIFTNLILWFLYQIFHMKNRQEKKQNSIKEPIAWRVWKTIYMWAFKNTGNIFYKIMC